MGKIYERILVERVQTDYAEKSLVNANQFGFKRGLSTEDAFSQFRKGVATSMKKYVVALFIDIEGAFDNLWWPAIRARLIEAECSGQLFASISSYFSQRTIKVRSSCEEVTRPMRRGCPQGSIIGPSLELGNG